MQNVKHYVVFDTVTGAILHKTQAQEDALLLADNQSALEAECDNVDQYYVDPDTIQLLPRMDFGVGSMVGNYYTIDVPTGTKAVWQGELYVVDDGTLEVLIDQPGSFLLVLSHPHYMTKEITIENQ